MMREKFYRYKHKLLEQKHKEYLEGKCVTFNVEKLSEMV